MYCPNCSTEASGDQKFCRTCGMELLAVAELVSGQSNLAKPERSTEAGFRGRQRAMLVWGFITMFGAVAIGASIKLLGKEGIRPAGDFTPLISIVALFAAFIGMGLMCYPFLEAMSPRGRGRERRAAELQSTVRLLDKEPSSVTEHTTELIEASRPRSAERDTAPQS
ncbi:MAG TPA: zinc ribbon domain-containing protein [Blastocatellia bacterium]|nr:zinc ribbon domain-containing protein [Blastocatellia bacterium]